MSDSTLHDNSVLIDGLIISNWSRSVFEDMQSGGITAANCTCCVWEGFNDTMANIAQWKQWFEEYDDILLQVHTSEDIRRAKSEGKVGIILGWQNTSGIEDQLGFLRLFNDLGVRVMQLTYNTQNLVGSGCWESRDGGLSDFGREVIDNMNSLGLMVDLSHVGAKTSSDAIAHSSQPVAYTHVSPNGLLDHPRNKTDEQLREIVDRDGFVGTAIYPAFLPWQEKTSFDNGVEVLDYMVNVCGEDSVGIGTDFTQDQSAEWFDWLRQDKGYARFLMEGKGTAAPHPAGWDSLSDYPLLTIAMERAGWKESRIEKVLGENWLAFYRTVWGA